MLVLEAGPVGEWSADYSPLQRASLSSAMASPLAVKLTTSPNSRCKLRQIRSGRELPLAARHVVPSQNQATPPARVRLSLAVAASSAT